MTAQRLHVLDERIQVMAVVGDMLAGVVAVLLHERGHLGFLQAVDAFDQSDAEIAIVDAPDLHAAVRVVRTGIVDSIDQGAAFDLDVKPRPALDCAGLHGVGDVVDLSQVGHFQLPASSNRRAGSSGLPAYRNGAAGCSQIQAQITTIA